MKLEFSRKAFEKHSNIKFNENPSTGSRIVPWEQTDGRMDRTDRTKLIVAFRNFANAPKNTLDLIMIFDINLEREVLLLWWYPMPWRVNFCRKDFIYIYTYIYIYMIDLREWKESV